MSRTPGRGTSRHRRTRLGTEAGRHATGTRRRSRCAPPPPATPSSAPPCSPCPSRRAASTPGTPGAPGSRGAAPASTRSTPATHAARHATSPGTPAPAGQGAEDETPAGAFLFEDVDEDLHFAGTAASCTSPDESTLRTRFLGDGGTVSIEAEAGSGQISLIGDDVFNGVIDSVSVGDAGDVVIRGTDASPDADGFRTTFVVTGRCPGA